MHSIGLEYIIVRNTCIFLMRVYPKPVKYTSCNVKILNLTEEGKEGSGRGWKIGRKESEEGG